MEIMVKLEGVKARVLADGIAEWLGEDSAVKYLPRPFLGYVIGSGAEEVTARTPWTEIAAEFVFVSCQGKLVIPDVMVGSSWFYNIVDGVRANGLAYDVTVPAAGPAEGIDFAPAAEAVLVPVVSGGQVQLPYILAGSARDNFLDLVDSKRTLISNALGVDDIPIHEDAWCMYFPWCENADSEAVRLLVEKMVAYAKDAKRISSVEHSTPNPKYAFRCFLLRLGFIGAEYAAARKVLLSKLSGNSAWLHGAPKKGGDL